MRSAIIAIALATTAMACTTEGDDAPVALDNNAGKADGSAITRFHVRGGHTATFTFHCDEWAYIDDCDIAVGLGLDTGDDEAVVEETLRQIGLWDQFETFGELAVGDILLKDKGGNQWPSDAYDHEWKLRLKKGGRYGTDHAPLYQIFLGEYRTFADLRSGWYSIDVTLNSGYPDLEAEIWASWE